MTTPPPMSGEPHDASGAGAERPDWLRPPPEPVPVPTIGGPPLPPPSVPTESADPGKTDSWLALPTYPPIEELTPPRVDLRTVDRKANRGLVAIAVVAIVAGATFTVANMGAGAGASSPENAVDGLLQSISGEDVIGTLETLRPAERDAFKGPLEDSIDELERLELLADVDLGDVQGVDVEIEGYGLRTTELAADVVAVTVSGGTVRGATTPTELPIGDTMRAILEEDLGVELPEGTQIESDDLGEFQLVAVEEGGGWYVSPGYSIAEWARQGSGEPLPAFGSVVPIGGDSPEASVRALADAAVTLDAEKAITQLDPEEMAALYDYAPLFLDDAEQAVVEARDDLEISLDLQSLRTEDGPDGTRKVYIDAFAFEAVEDTEYDDNSYSVTYDGECFRYEETWTYEYFTDVGSYEGEEYTPAPETETSSGEWCRGEPLVTENEYDDGLELPALDAPFDQLALVTVERDGRWYVAPGRSILEVIPAFLRGVDAGDIDTMREWLRELVGPIDYQEFDEVGSIIDDGDYYEDGSTSATTGFSFERGPIEECNDFLGTMDYDLDPVHADAPVERLSYLYQQRVNDCVRDLAAEDGMPSDELEMLTYDDPCWDAYQRMGPKARAVDWAVADGMVVACFETSYPVVPPPVQPPGTGPLPVVED